jgi:RNA polymerase subunit RPABC4/transcription elongation factor Spt4
MSEAPERIRRRSAQRSAPVSLACPACGATLKVDSKWCPSCNFTGGDTIAMFSDSPPPLLPILDAAGIWKESELGKIEAARDSLQKRYPQLHWRVCTVCLPPDTRLPLFGFWLLNACPLYEKETTEERAWTVLLLIDTTSDQAAAIPGYAAETCLGDGDLQKILASMTSLWESGKTTDAVISFFKTCRTLLDESWKRSGARRANK